MNGISRAYQTVSNAWTLAKQAGQSVYDWGKSKTRESKNIAYNWTKALEETIRHVCEVAGRATDGTTVHASTVTFEGNISIEKARLDNSLEIIKASSKSDSIRSDEIIKAYEDYLYNTNKAAFDEYWTVRKNLKLGISQKIK
ncbi:hypothetical protein [Streptococcus gallinaceus]|uniref:Uncharacterized protein n=1 Tax=Streptococcus gallinaceus TaxID=165758 RepID=A0ABV2JLT0_9STRE|nr:hypothetical protein [Streptococcus gallinaceus]MCP1639947.1 hypothetical protein [Streptococcus gallinaceus]MCP1770681.1 hypothetical protein [Streptococcus gallinaceus]